MTSAKIFLSCGQDKNTDEVSIAQRIREGLEKLGFEVYIAVREQVLRGVKENILRQLETSEYFLFVDFRRDQLANSAECRGSLFSHQELAVASYLDLDVLAFQEDGVRKHDGLLGYLQTNCIPFSDRRQLPALVEAEVTARGWKPTWRRTLELEFHCHSDAMSARDGMRRTYYQVRVDNHHRTRPARNCFVYLALKRYPDLGEQALYFLPTEVRWSGHELPNVLIPPRWGRVFDAFSVNLDKWGGAEFETFATSTQFRIPSHQNGTSHLTYAVMSDDFPIALATFELKVFPSDPREIQFKKTDLDPAFKGGWPG